MKPTTATVWSATGEKTRIQSSPSSRCDDYWYIPNWTQVYVTEFKDCWAQIRIGDFIGYIRRERLLFGGDRYADELES